jgi:dTDP-D-glucose 4,6-dehydratase
MNRKTLFLTGANGFVGSNVLSYVLYNTDWDVICPTTSLHHGSQDRIYRVLEDFQENLETVEEMGLKSPDPRHVNERVNLVRCDLSQPFSPSLFGNRYPDYIWNIASESHVDRSLKDPVPFVENNVRLILNVLEYTRKVQPRVFLNMSTDEVFGPAPEGYSHHEWDEIKPSNPYCVVPGTDVLTRNGTVPIEEVAIYRDRVLAKGVEGTGSQFCDGVPSRTWEFSYVGDMIKIKTFEGAEEITCTPDHKLLVRTTGYSNDTTFLGKPRPHSKIEWRCAKDIREGDRVCIIKKAPMPSSTVGVENEYARFLGYWMADGYYNRKNRYLTLADQKKEYIEFYRDQVSSFIEISKKSSTGALGTIYKHSAKNCWYYQLSSESLRNRVDLSDRMNVINLALNFDELRLAQFIAGWIDGDGCIMRDDSGKVVSVSVTSVDDRLRKNLKLMLRRLGVVSTDRADNQTVTVTNSEGLQTLYNLVPSLKWRAEESFRKPQKKRGRGGKWIWARVQKVESFKYDGKVYDLEIDKYHNYIANYFVSHNSASKAAQESICYSYWRAYNIPLVLTNTMNLIAPGPGYQSSEKFVPKVVKKILDNETVDIHATPEGVSGSRCWIDVRDFAEAWHFLTTKLEDDPNLRYYPNMPDRCIRYNIVGPEASNLEVAQTIARIMGKELNYRMVNFHQSRPGHDPRYSLDGSKLRDFGWTPRRSLDETLRDIVTWYLDNPETLEE